MSEKAEAGPTGAVGTPGDAGRLESDGQVDMVNRPNHYAPNGVDSFMHMKDQMGADAFRGFLQGNAMKYVQRYAFKGKPVEDLTKAAFYLFHLAFEMVEPGWRPVLRKHLAKTLGHAAGHYGLSTGGEVAG